ncbi:type VI secretion system Vgr family protein [Aquimarina latercula]|uniref:type VI secretion system Vgr family protein n=1 Tax=Aquimarina latercula TaxID=987 RepID=UPI00041521B0|nr:phage baseplate assembly protein V [Aquimarina latercula]
MALQTSTQIFIAGTPVNAYINLRLQQEISAHHTLELVCRKDVVESVSNELVGESKDYLGEIITVNISSVTDLGGYKELEFKGIVTEIKATQGFESAKGDLVTIIARSTSILAEDGAHYASFSDVSLLEILDTTFQGYDRGALETSFTPRMNETIHYSVQYKTSAFEYASRLSAYYNEWFYYDGQKLVFGSPGTNETVLTNGVDLQHFSLKLKTVPNSFEYFTNDYENDQTHNKNSSEVSLNSDGYLGFMNNKSEQLYNKKSQVYHHPYQDTSLQSRFDTQIEQYTRSRALNQKVAVGASDNPGVHLGEIINVTGHGSYRITKVTHTNIEGGSYKNQFEAVQAGNDDYPLMDIQQYPKSVGNEIATVVDNADPDGMSRIKVQCIWQKQSGETTPWIRVMTPHAGGDKGFHFIPEKGEEIILGYEAGNIERPFVMGTMYNGTAKPDSWQTDTNDIKAIKTRSGHLIEFKDTDGAESITITDKNSNVINIDTANNNITVTALEEMTLNAKNLKINVQENFDVSVGENKNESIGNKQTLTAKQSTILIDEKAQFQSKELEKNAEKITINSTKDNLDLSSAKQVVSNSSEKNILI